MEFASCRIRFISQPASPLRHSRVDFASWPASLSVMAGSDPAIYTGTFGSRSAPGMHYLG